MLDWLQHHRRLAVLALCLLIAALIALLITVALLPDGGSFINAWYV